MDRSCNPLQNNFIPAPLPDPETVDELELRAYWTTLFRMSPKPVIRIDESDSLPRLMELGPDAGGIIDFDSISDMLGEDYIMRVPFRDIYGYTFHAYTGGYKGDSQEGYLKWAGGRRNAHAENLFANGTSVAADIYGPVILVRAEVIHPRDREQALVEINAPTLPELERDYLTHVGEASCGEFVAMREALKGNIIPSMSSAVPTIDKMAWLVRFLLSGITMDFDAYAALRTTMARFPEYEQAYVALNNIQANYFSGRIEEFAPADPFAEVGEAPPPGYDKKYGQTKH